jgi:hypothetical protein
MHASRNLRVSSYVLLALLVVIGVNEATAVSVRDRCSLGEHVRPIVYTPGFGGSVLFNYSNSYSPVYPNGEDAFGDVPIIPAQNLALSLQWNSAGTQQASEVGPKRSPTDNLPGTDGMARSFISAVRFWTCYCSALLFMVGLMCARLSGRTRTTGGRDAYEQTFPLAKPFQQRV